MQKEVLARALFLGCTVHLYLTCKTKVPSIRFHYWLLYGKLLETLLYFIATLNQNKQENCIFQS